MLNFAPLSLGRITFRGSLFTAIFIATALTFSCSSGDDDDSGGSVTYEGKTYNTVRIGNQTWMAENMNHAVSGSKCYDDNPANCEKYGRLYDWATAKTVCPSGWHLPSIEDWDILMEHVQTDNGSTYTSGSTAFIAGKYLKATSGWENNGNGEDKYGFTALPGGYGYSDGGFSTAGGYGGWWSASDDAGGAYGRGMAYDNEYVRKYYSDSSSLYSVRCLQD